MDIFKMTELHPSSLSDDELDGLDDTRQELNYKKSFGIMHLDIDKRSDLSRIMRPEPVPQLKEQKTFWYDTIAENFHNTKAK